jgi:hypothetical protein
MLRSPSPALLCSRSPTLTHLQQLLIAKMAQGKHTSAPKRQNTPASSQNSATKKQKMTPRITKALPALTKPPTRLSPRHHQEEEEEEEEREEEAEEADEDEL